MTEPKIYTAEEAKALLAAATPGPWLDGPPYKVAFDESRNMLSLSLLSGDMDLVCAVHDIARSVIHHARRADEAERQRDHLAAKLVRQTRDAACWRFMTENGVPNDTETAMAAWWRDSGDRDALVQMLGADVVEQAEVNRD